MRDSHGLHIEIRGRADDRLCAWRRVYSRYVQANARAGRSHHAAQRRKSTAVRIKQPPHEDVERRIHPRARWPHYLQGLLTQPITQPQQRWQIGNVIRMEVTDAQE